MQALHDVKSFHQRWYLFAFYLLAAYVGKAPATGGLIGLAFAAISGRTALLCAVTCAAFAWGVFQVPQVRNLFEQRKVLTGAEGKRSASG